MKLDNTLCFVGANSSLEEVQSPRMLMGGPKSNVPFGVGKRTFIKLFAFAFISAFYAVSLLEFRPVLISFSVQPACGTIITGNTSLILQFNKNTITYKYSASILRHHAFWPLYLLCTLLIVPRNWKSVSSFVGDQIKAKEDHLMPLYIFMQFYGSAKFTHYSTADCKRMAATISSCLLGFGIH